MGGKSHELELRRAATEKTLAKFRGQPFHWRHGKTCIHMARQQARAMGVRVPTLPPIRSELSAKRALKERNVESLSELLDQILPRIAPAAMKLGDLAAVKGIGGLDAIFINAGPRKFFGWREDAPVLVVLDITLDQIDAAWSLTPPGQKRFPHG